MNNTSLIHSGIDFKGETDEASKTVPARKTRQMLFGEVWGR